jgi:endogenous inhibitor of DNA gyrase (YacG/DUF329 family)
MKCPHCDKEVYRHTLTDIDRAERHAEAYGSGFTTSECPLCHKKFTFYTELKAIIFEPKKATEDACLSY